MKPNSDTLFVNTYGKKRIVMSRGKGCMLWDERGKRYLDFFGGIAVNALGYGNKKIAKLMAQQYKKLAHISNIYVNKPAVSLAEAILHYQPIPNRTYSGIFFSNSGAEANEAALKFASIYVAQERTRPPLFAAFQNAFHGRTFLTLALTSKEKYRGMYEKLLPSVIRLPYNDSSALHSNLTPRVGAVIVEVIQGEGGMHTLNDKCALLLNRMCNSNDIILIADEVQTGLGRTGTVYASEAIGLKPDIITIAKPLGGGLPLGATLVTNKIAQHVTPGIHGSTFGGGPIPCTVGQEVWKRITDPTFLATVKKTSGILDEMLVSLASNRPNVVELLGFGLLRGMRLRADVDVHDVIKQLRMAGLLVIPSGDDVIRLTPPLVITPNDIVTAGKILDTVLKMY